MKRQALEQVVEQHVHKIKKHSGQIPGAFDEKNIHDLRVEYKKLRAFLRLLGVTAYEKLKKLYKAAGAVRDLQLFLKINMAAPVFIQAKQRELFACKEKLVRVTEDTGFKKIKIEKGLPDHALQKFVQERTAAIHILLLAGDEEKHLHGIRKNYKDIIYNNKLFGIEDESLNAIATQLGDFNDRCIALSLLQDRGHIPEEENAVLDKLQSDWEKEKQLLLQHLLHLHTSGSLN